MMILIVDDEESIRVLIKYNVEKAGYQAVLAKDGLEAVDIARSMDPALIVLDLMMPGMTGLDVCRILKNDNRTKNIPVIMATAKTEDSDIVAGLELGADDYITKPFSPKVLIARIQSVLRRYAQKGVLDKQSDGEEPVVSIGNPEAMPDEIKIRTIEICHKKHLVKAAGKKIDLSSTEFDILELLAAHPEQVFSRKQIINAVKGDSYPVTERAVDVQIVNIRRKIGDYSHEKENDNQPLIETIRGVGYRFSGDS